MYQGQFKMLEWELEIKEQTPQSKGVDVGVGVVDNSAVVNIELYFSTTTIPGHKVDTQSYRVLGNTVETF